MRARCRSRGSWSDQGRWKCWGNWNMPSIECRCDDEIWIAVDNNGVRLSWGDDSERWSTHALYMFTSPPHPDQQPTRRPRATAHSKKHPGSKTSTYIRIAPTEVEALCHTQTGKWSWIPAADLANANLQSGKRLPRGSGISMLTQVVPGSLCRERPAVGGRKVGQNVVL